MYRFLTFSGQYIWYSLVVVLRLFDRRTDGSGTHTVLSSERLHYITRRPHAEAGQTVGVVYATAT